MYIWGSDNADDHGRVFTRMIEDRNFSYGNFEVPVYHKRRRKYVQWKDIGTTMSVPLFATQSDRYDTPSVGALAILDRHKGIDDETGNVYRYAYRTHTDSIESINTVWDTGFGLQATEYADVLVGYEGGFEPSNDSLHEAMSALYFLQLCRGKREQRDTTLHGIKIALPLIASTIHHQEQVLTRVDTLRANDIIIKMDVLEHDDGAVVQLASRDICLLEQFVLWHKPLATWPLISTKDFTQSLSSSLEDFLGEKIQLAADQLLKFGSVQ